MPRDGTSPENYYLIHMKFRYLITILPILFAANVFAGELPDLGDVSQATISLRQERELGLQIMSEIRADPRLPIAQQSCEYWGAQKARATNLE